MVETILHGTLIGKIWMPAITCHKPVKINLTNVRSRYSGGPAGTFRHTLDMHVTNDGDFQSCALTKDSYLELRSTVVRGNRRVTRQKFIALEDLPSAADFLTDEMPEYSEEE